MTIHAGADLLAVFAFDQVRNAHRELNDLDAALHGAGRIGQCLAVLLRHQLRQFGAIGIE